MNINTITKYLVEQGELQPIPEGITQRTYEDMVNTSEGKNWTPPSQQKLIDTWKIIEPDIKAAEQLIQKREKFLNDRREAYNQAGATQEALVEALVEHISESKPEKLAALPIKRHKVKSDIPEPDRI